jgi:hypothetical protein
MLTSLILTAVIAAPHDNQHITFSALGAGASYAGASLLTDDRTLRLAFSVSVPLAAGFGREFTQAQMSAQWTAENTRDMGRNLLGCALGAAVSWAIDRFVDSLARR